MDGWTDAAAIESWSTIPREVLEAMDPEGHIARQHLLNPTRFELLGAVHDRRGLDAGCGQGYFSRLLADRGADVVGVEPAPTLFDYCVEHEQATPRGVRYERRPLTAIDGL